VAERDHIDGLVGQWAAERPDLDLRPMATVARLLHIGRLAADELARGARRFGVEVPEGDVLFTLRRSGRPYRLTPSELSKSLLVSSGTLTSRLDRLEAKGLIRRVAHPSDRRSTEVELTDAGLALVDEAVAVHVDHERELLSALSDAEIERLDRLTRKLLAHLVARGDRA
jgi:DNA-binding MarR family transcriptional regulator